MKNMVLLILALLLGSGLAFSQQKDSLKNAFTGRLSEDSRMALSSYKTEVEPSLINPSDRKSPFLAGLLSGILPGAGEVYSKSYWKAAVFMAIEATAIYAAISYNKKGDDATLEFKNYADDHWSAARYAKWLNQFATQLGALNPPAIQIKDDPNLKPWEQVDFKQINAVEQLVPTFSHRLEIHGYQQYYELIGKYDQFNHGWDQSDPNTSEYFANVPQQMINYSAMFTRPDETFYKYSQRAVTVLLLNHLLSVIDAVWSTHNYNKDLTMNVNLNQVNMAGLIDYYPQLNLKYRF